MPNTSSVPSHTTKQHCGRKAVAFAPLLLLLLLASTAALAIPESFRRGAVDAQVGLRLADQLPAASAAAASASAAAAAPSSKVLCPSNDASCDTANSTSSSSSSSSSSSAPVQQEAAPAETQPSATPKNVLILSEGRSGSTLLMHYMSRLAGTMTLFEPFHDFDPEPVLEGNVFHVQPPLAGAFDTLYNCSFTDNLRTLNRVMWDDRQLGAWINDSAMSLRVRDAKLTRDDADFMHAKCLASRIRIVKAIRFSGYISDAFVQQYQALNVSVVHLLRKPSHFIQSQLEAKFLSRDEAVQSNCERIRHKLTMLDSLPNLRLLRLWHEDLVANPHEVMQRVSSFLDEPRLPTEVINAIAPLSQDVYDLEGTPKAKERKDDPLIESRFKTQCPDVYDIIHRVKAPSQ